MHNYFNMFYTVREINEVIKRIKKKQFKEQESTGSLPDKEPSISNEPKTTTSSNNNVTKWESGVKRGKANPINDKSKWESGVTRGKANPIN